MVPEAFTRMFSSTFHELLKVEWEQLRARRALPCMIAILASLAAGLLTGHPAGGMVAAGGAMTVGFGSFQWLGASRVAPMLWATGGMAVSAVGGSLVGHAGPGFIFNAAFAGLGAGLLLALGPGASWIGQQCAIVALVASGYPAGWEIAVSRALLILAGGALQTAVMILFWRWRHPRATPAEGDSFQGVAPALRTLWTSLRTPTDARHYALRQAATLAVAAEMEHHTGLPNGYWVPMTALLVLRPAFQPTFQRGVLRVAGTIVGAALATLLVRTFHLNEVAIAMLIALFAWLAYALVNVNYGLFAIFLTAYIVFLLDFAGLSTQVIVAHRTLNTALAAGWRCRPTSPCSCAVGGSRMPTRHPPRARPRWTSPQRLRREGESRSRRGQQPTDRFLLEGHPGKSHTLSILRTSSGRVAHRTRAVLSLPSRNSC